MIDESLMCVTSTNFPKREMSDTALKGTLKGCHNILHKPQNTWPTDHSWKELCECQWAKQWQIHWLAKHQLAFPRLTFIMLAFFLSFRFFSWKIEKDQFVKRPYLEFNISGREIHNKLKELITCQKLMCCICTVYHSLNIGRFTKHSPNNTVKKVQNNLKLMYSICIVYHSLNIGRFTKHSPYKTVKKVQNNLWLSVSYSPPYFNYKLNTNHLVTTTNAYLLLCLQCLCQFPREHGWDTEKWRKSKQKVPTELPWIPGRKWCIKLINTNTLNILHYYF